MPRRIDVARVSQGLVAQAVQVARWALDLRDQIMVTGSGFAESREVTMKRQAAKKAMEAKLDRLATDAPDLRDLVDDWLRDVPDPMVVPVRERLWEILRDEKVLERARRGRLFGPGRLTDHLLAIEPAFAPVATSRHGPDPGRVVLVVENWGSASCSPPIPMVPSRGGPTG